MFLENVGVSFGQCRENQSEGASKTLKYMIYDVFSISAFKADLTFYNP